MTLASAETVLPRALADDHLWPDTTNPRSS